MWQEYDNYFHFFRSFITLHAALVLRLFLFYHPRQYNPLLNLRPLVIGLTPFGWLRSYTQTPAYSITSYGNIVFYLRPLFGKCGSKKGTGVINKLVN